MTFRTLSLSPLRVGVVSALIVAALVLSGCAGGSSPQVSGSASSSASESASPSPTQTPVYKPADAKGRAENVPVPVLPEEAKAETKEGLEAFAKYWYQTLGYAYETGDTSLVAEASESTCKFCNGLGEGVVTAWKDGRWVVGGQIQTPSISANFEAGAKSQEVVLQVIQEKIEIREADGNLYQDSTMASNSATHAVAVFTNSGWRFSDLGLIR